LTPAGPVAGVTSAVIGVFSSIIQFGQSRTPCPIRKLTSAQFCGNATYNTTNHSISNHVIRRQVLQFLLAQH
jgi:hypothetical protein